MEDIRDDVSSKLLPVLDFIVFDAFLWRLSGLITFFILFLKWRNKIISCWLEDILNMLDRRLVAKKVVLTETIGIHILWGIVKEVKVRSKSIYRKIAWV